MSRREPRGEHTTPGVSQEVEVTLDAEMLQEVFELADE